MDSRDLAAFLLQIRGRHKSYCQDHRGLDLLACGRINTKDTMCRPPTVFDSLRKLNKHIIYLQVKVFSIDKIRLSITLIL